MPRRLAALLDCFSRPGGPLVPQLRFVGSLVHDPTQAVPAEPPRLWWWVVADAYYRRWLELSEARLSCRQANHPMQRHDATDLALDILLIVATGPARDRAAIARRGPQRGRRQSDPRLRRSRTHLCSAGSSGPGSAERCRRDHDCAPNASWANCWLLMHKQPGGDAARTRSQPATEVPPTSAVTSASPRASRRAGRRSPRCPSTSSIGTSPTCASRVAATARPS